MIDCWLNIKNKINDKSLTLATLKWYETLHNKYIKKNQNGKKGNIIAKHIQVEQKDFFFI